MGTASRAGRSRQPLTAMDRQTFDGEAFRRFEYESWERVAPRYPQSWALVTRQFGDLLLAALDLEPGTRLLDIACGPGNVAAAAHARGAVAVGVDFSPAMIRLARERQGDCAGPGGPVFRIADAEALPFAAASFDAAAMNFGIMHLADPALRRSPARFFFRPGGARERPGTYGASRRPGCAPGSGARRIMASQPR
ncbi:MAG TPA: methyltransferase domain-containing protein [Thermoanaerobaculia bacterium]|nr:methyltransferase domain-containing protein [Thermoanaerobaculia bacterium]